MNAEGRIAAMLSAASHGPEWVWSRISTLSATIASQVPAPEPRLARKRSRKLRARATSES